MRRLGIVFLSVFILLVNKSDIFAGLLINEVFPDPEGEEKLEEWVELYNNGSEAIDITGFVLKDNANHELIISKDYISEEVLTVEPYKWIVIRRNNHPKFSLNNSDEEIIRLYKDKDTEPIDEFSYTDSVKGKSWGRIPDGGLIYSDPLDSTPGLSNFVAVKLVVTEQPTPGATVTNKPTSFPKPTQTLAPTPTSTKLNIKQVSKVTTENNAPFPEDAPDSEAVLGVRNEISPTAFESSDISSKENLKDKLFAGLFMAGGIVLITLALFPFLKRKYMKI